MAILIESDGLGSIVILPSPHIAHEEVMTMFDRKRRGWLCVLAIAALALSLGGCGGSSGSGGSDASNPTEPTVPSEEMELTGTHTIVLNADGTATYDGAAVTAYDYVWHASPTVSVDWYTEGQNGTERLTEAQVLDAVGGDAVYIARDIRYLPSGLTFTGTAQNDGEQERACYYSDEVRAEVAAATGSTGPFIFATLPQNGNESSMTHSASDAYACPVLHITEPGSYALSGTWKGQIWIDAGDETDSSAKIALYLNGVTVDCGVGPALVFHDIYECGPSQEGSVVSFDVGDAVAADAGAKVVIVDGTTNSFTGTNVYRMLKPAAKNSSVTAIDGTDVSQQKKLWKMDGAFYSFVSMVIDGSSSGSGVLKISSGYEGLNTEMHLTIEGGTVDITAADDGINVNEDYVSVFTMNDGTLTINTTGGDGIDSNGWIVLNGGTVTITSTSAGDNALDSIYEDGSGIYIGPGVTYNGNAPGGGGGMPGGGTPPDGGGTPPGGGTPHDAPPPSGDAPPDGAPPS
ncbi:MAG: carbohydrate-binding domain-containing protein [Synergistaceae bacterium]|nr:carbohydrate-binding domain-containing protein [Synergistaceae bacterium]